MNHRLSTVFFGTPQIAADVLRELLQDSLFDIRLVVTGRTKTRGRHSAVPTAVHQVAAAHNCALFECDSAKDPALLERLQSESIDIGIIVAWRILPAAIYGYPRLGTLNMHGSLLPKYRGAAPVQRAIMAGDTTTGITVFQLNEGVDTGQILSTHEFAISPSDTSGDLFTRMVHPGVNLLHEAAYGLSTQAIHPRSQSDELASGAPKIRPEERLIDWSQPMSKVRCLIHGLSPAPGAYSMLANERVTIFRVSELSEMAGTPGTIRVFKQGWQVSCSDGWLRIEQAAREGRTTLSSRDFAAGMQRWDDKQFS